MDLAERGIAMRLTKYEPSKNSMFPYKLRDEESSTELDATHKLGRLEDIEDELGIDLITLLKSFEEDIWIKFDNKIMFVPYDKKDFVFYAGNIDCYPSNEPYGYTVSIDDYGKTWALTKEELL